MVFSKNYYKMEVLSTNKEDVVFIRMVIKKHKPIELLKDQIFELSDLMYEAFLGEFDNSSNARTAVQLFMNQDRIAFIKDKDFPLVDERYFSIDSILKEGQVEADLINGDMFSSTQDACLSEKTLIYIEAFQTIRPHVKWIQEWDG